MNYYERLIDKVGNKFNPILIEFCDADQSEKKEILINMYNEIKDDVSLLASESPGRLIEVISQIRNPMLQYEVISNNKLKLSTFINSMSEERFSEKFKRYFYYPYTEYTEMDDYINSWIVYGKIHVKFTKDILSDKYEGFKNLLKLDWAGQANLLVGHGVDFNGYLKGIDFTILKPKKGFLKGREKKEIEKQ